MSSLPMSTWVPTSSVRTSSVVSPDTGPARGQSRTPKIGWIRSSGPIAFQLKICTARGSLRPEETVDVVGLRRRDRLVELRLLYSRPDGGTIAGDAPARGQEDRHPERKPADDAAKDDRVVEVGVGNQRRV